MPGQVDPAQLVEAHEVARLLRLSWPSAVSVYLHRYPDFPRPIVDPGPRQARYWLRSDILMWASLRKQKPPDGKMDLKPEAGVAPDAAIESPSSSATHDLPSAANALIGRERELADVAQALTESRLIVVTGPSGVGKTRLVREAGARVASRHPDRVHLVELAAIRAPHLVSRAVATVLSVWEEPGRPLLDTLMSHLRGRRLLLVLDNCEHVLEECARVADALLQSCPDLSVLATSQAPFGIGGEQVWPLAPLAIPGAEAPTELVASSEAVSLFTLRAAATSAGFSLTPPLVPIVAEICRRLDGLPLAIELAAARVAVLSPQEILARIDNRFAILTGGSRAVLPRHQTLQAAFEWSHDLLSKEEAVLMRRLSVFSGGCTLEAVEAVCADEGREHDVLVALTGLVAKSLTLANTSGAEARYRMLETIRLFGAERLERSGEAAALQRRHANWCLALAERAEPALTGENQLPWLERLETEHDNLRTGLAWAISEREADLALRLAGALTIFWRVHCHFREARDWLSAALTLEGHPSGASRATALWGLGFMDVMLALESASAELQESLAIAHEAGDARGEARALLLLGNREWQLGDFERSIALARQVEDFWCLAHALACAGKCRLMMGEVRSAHALLQESVDVGRRSRDQQSLRLGLNFLGELLIKEGRYDEAETVIHEVLELSRRLGEPYIIAVNLARLGKLAAGRGDFHRARDLLGTALGMEREGAAALTLNSCLADLGWFELSLGQLDAARGFFEEAHSLAQGAGLRSFSALHGLGEVALIEDRWTEAEALFDEARSDLHPDAKPDAAGIASSKGRLARARGDIRKATLLCAEALALRYECSEAPGVARSLEEMAGLAAQAGQAERAGRLFGAALAVRKANGYARAPALQSGYEADVDLVRRRLGPKRSEALLREGRNMSLDEAVSYALKGRDARGRPQTGWSALTRSERDITGLVAKGLTNREIGAQLFVSPRTVETHLTSVFSKVGLSSRRELAKAAGERGM